MTPPPRYTSSSTTKLGRGWSSILGVRLCPPERNSPVLCMTETRELSCVAASWTAVVGTKKKSISSRTSRSSLARNPEKFKVSLFSPVRTQPGLRLQSTTTTSCFYPEIFPLVDRKVTPRTYSYYAEREAK